MRVFSEHKDTKARRFLSSWLTTLCLCTFVFHIFSCSHIDEADRLIYVKPAAAKRCVLLEDFTGQRCINCPKATDIIAQLEEEYGDSAFIAVGIHGGPLGFHGNANVTGLATDTGDEYYDHWHLEYQPVGLINRPGAVNYTDWPAIVKEELAKPAPLTIKAEATMDNDGHMIDINLTMTGTDGNTTGKLQIWLLEDRIEAMQLMPDGTANSKYLHNHVLRTAVNGTWGEDFSIKEGETKVVNKSLKRDLSWDYNTLSIVAFVYNDQGVQQAAKARIDGHGLK